MRSRYLARYQAGCHIMHALDIPARTYNPKLHLSLYPDLNSIASFSDNSLYGVCALPRFFNGTLLPSV
jgi:hypothetical protein